MWLCSVMRLHDRLPPTAAASAPSICSSCQQEPGRDVLSTSLPPHRHLPGMDLGQGPLPEPVNSVRLLARDGTGSAASALAHNSQRRRNPAGREEEVPKGWRYLAGTRERPSRKLAGSTEYNPLCAPINPGHIRSDEAMPLETKTSDATWMRRRNSRSWNLTTRRMWRTNEKKIENGRGG